MTPPTSRSAPAPGRLRAGLGRALAYQRPFHRRVAGQGLVAVAPVSVAFALATLVASALWCDPGAGHRVVAACCAWRAADLVQGRLLPLLGSALLVRRPVEAVWTVAATWLLLGPLEAVVGSRRLLVLGAVGHVVSTVAIDLCWLATGRIDASLAGLDVGTSAVVVTATAALAVCTGSLPLALALATGLAVDLATTPSLVSVEHLVAAAVGVAGALTLRPSHRLEPIPGAAGGGPGGSGPLRARHRTDPRRQHDRGIPLPLGRGRAVPLPRQRPARRWPARRLAGRRGRHPPLRV